MKSGSRAVAVAGVSAALSLGPAPHAIAEPWTWTYEGDEAVCSFPLVVSGGVAGGQQVFNREFYDRDGNLRVLSAGTGEGLTFTNGVTGASFSSPKRGAVTWTRYGADGVSRTMSLTGHNAVFLYANDHGGPSARLYWGRVVVYVDVHGAFEVIADNGRSLEICAELGG